MTRNGLISGAILLLGACATTPPPTPEAPVAEAKPAPKKPLEPVPGEPISVPSGIAHDLLLTRARSRLGARNFIYDAPVRPGFPPMAYGRGLVASNTRMLPDPFAEEPKCVGTAEVVQVEAGIVADRPMLRLLCYSDELGPPEKAGGECRHHPVPGCGQGGDQLVGEIALDAASFL